MTEPQPPTEPRPKPRDRAEAAGYPPDSGPEKQVLVLRPSLMRNHPLPCFLLGVVPVGAAVAIAILGALALPIALIAGAAIVGVFWIFLTVWWVKFSLSRSLEITNKRTIQHMGLLARSTTEVLHDHIRNVQIRQSFGQRIMGVGEIGISSAADSSIEVDMTGIPDPYKVRKVIDLYRPLG